MLNVAVCEDEPMQLEIILTLLKKYKAERPGIDIIPYPFDSGDKMLQSIEGGQNFHLFLLDILLPSMSGIELAQILREKFDDVPVVFLTSSSDYALDAFKVSAIQYILKPVRRDVLFSTLDNITSIIRLEKERFFMVNTQNYSVKIPYRSIVCVELSGRSLQFHLDNGDVMLSKSIRVPFADAITPLIQDNRFLYAHKSFLINMEHVKKIGNTSFIMNGGLEVPVPRYNFSKAKAKYFEWTKEQDNYV